MSNTNKKNILLYLYYGLLMFILLSWTNTEEAPNVVLRSVFLLASVMPALLWDKSFLAPVIICFLGICQNGFAHGYMPDNLLFYVAILGVGAMILHPVRSFLRVPQYLWSLFTYITLVDLLTGFTVEKVSLTFVVSVLLLLFTSSKSLKDINLWSLSFVLISFFLSLLFIINRDKFAEAYYGQGLERTTWMDPNYFGMVIGMGYTVALLELLGHGLSYHESKRFDLFRILYVATIILSVIVLVLNASRGALLAVAAATTVALIFSRVKMGGKIVIVALMVAGIVFLYQNSYFDLLEYRMENEHTAEGNGRYYIWHNKLSTFFSGDPISMIIGYGYDGGLKLGYNTIRRGTHNDFISFLVEYGVIGFIMFLIMLLKPVFKAFKSTETKIIVLSLMAYLAVCCFSLEPITGAYIPYLFFYFYIVLIAYSTAGTITNEKNTIYNR